MSFARLLPGVAAQPGNALRAASTAASTSAGVPRGIWPTTSPFAGLRTRVVLPPWASTSSPPMSILAMLWTSLWITTSLGARRQDALAADPRGHGSAESHRTRASTQVRRLWRVRIAEHRLDRGHDRGRCGNLSEVVQHH